MKNIFKLIIAIVACEFVGIAGSFFTASSIPTWYAGLARPQLAPPNWIFGPVWTTLFLLMGISLYLVWKKGFKDRTAKIAVGIFIGQLVLNFFWSVIFFGLRNPGWAFIEIIFLWLSIVASILFFKKISRTAAWLLLPYLVWVIFAAYLNFSIWTLN